MTSVFNKRMKNATKLIVFGFIRHTELLLPNDRNPYYNIPPSIALIMYSFIENYYENSGIYEWKITNKQLLEKILNAKCGDKFESNKFIMSKLSWKLQLYPFGDDIKTNDQYFVIRLKLLSLPTAIDKIEFSRIFRVHECNASAGWCSSISSGDISKWSKKLPSRQIVDVNPQSITVQCEINVYQLILKKHIINYSPTTIIQLIKNDIIHVFTDKCNQKIAKKILKAFNDLMDTYKYDVYTILDHKGWIAKYVMSDADLLEFGTMCDDFEAILSKYEIVKKYNLRYDLDKENMIFFMNSEPDKTMCSNILNDMWIIQCTPNGDGKAFWGKISIFLLLYKLPFGVHSLETKFTIGCVELGKKYTLNHVFSMENFGWGASEFATLQEMKTFESITFVIDVEIIKIGYKNGEELTEINDPMQISALLTE